MRLPPLQSQAGLPTRGGLAAVAPVGDAALAQAAERAGQTATALVTQLQAKRTQLQQATDLLQAQSALQGSADDLLTSLATDADYRTMEARYPKDFDRASQSLLKGIRDPEVKLAAERTAQSLRFQLTGSVRTRAVTLQQEDFKGTLEARLDRYEKTAAQAEDEATLTTLATRAFGEIDAGVMGGVYGRDDAVARKLKFRDDVIQAKAAGLINAVGTGATSFEAALTRLDDPEGLYAEADPTKREGWTKAIFTAEEARLRRLEKADRDLEQARKAESSRLRDGFTDLHFRGALDLDAVEAVGPNGTRALFGEDYRAVRELAQKPITAVGVDDPAVVQRVRREMVLGVTSPVEVLRLAGDGLSQATANDLAAQIKAAAREDHPSKDPEWTFYRTRLIEQITGRSGLEALMQPLSDAQRGRLDFVLDQFWVRTVDKRERPREVYQTLMADVVGRAPVPVPLPDLPRFASPTDTQEAFDRGLIGPRDLYDEKRKWKALQDAQRATQPAPSPTPKPGLFERFFGGERK